MTTLTGWFKKLLTDRTDNCIACGECCRQFGWHLIVSQNDLERWRRQGRHDLLRGVNRLGWIWIDPDTGRRLPVCPYLQAIEGGTFICSIHSTKPDMCREYPSAVQFGQCLRGLQVREACRLVPGSSPLQRIIST